MRCLCVAVLAAVTYAAGTGASFGSPTRSAAFSECQAASLARPAIYYGKTANALALADSELTYVVQRITAEGEPGPMFLTPELSETIVPELLRHFELRLEQGGADPVAWT